MNEFKKEQAKVIGALGLLILIGAVAAFILPISSWNIIVFFGK